jgi:hypothetical protein
MPSMKSKNYQPPQPESPSIVPEAPPVPKVNPLAEVRELVGNSRRIANDLLSADQPGLALLLIDCAYAVEQAMMRDHASRP